ncbi:uncharacterized protein [Salminus brasiliensis]|uniref:uncharacterized protein n=1 Tax=Salminus brasiliensis TaxID=930266 RepID=UPI003B8304D0
MIIMTSYISLVHQYAQLDKQLGQVGHADPGIGLGEGLRGGGGVTLLSLLTESESLQLIPAGAALPEELVTENMASAILLFLAVASSSLCSGALTDRLLSVECQPAAGVVGQSMKISCLFRTSLGIDQDIIINTVFVYKNGQKDPLFTIKNSGGSGDPRFRLPSVSDPSLELTDTALTDEGEYLYMLSTNRGIIKDGVFRISVTAKYSQPTMKSWPEKIVEGQGANLYCNVSGGYPAGVIHWFDQVDTDWTKSATLTIKEGEDKLLQMSSKLSFTKFDLSWAPFRCVVLNSRNVQEGESTFQPEGLRDASVEDKDKQLSTNIVAPVVVIGSLLVGLLLVILLRGRCGRPSRRPSTVPILSGVYTSNDMPDVEEAVNLKQPFGEATEVKT